MLNNGGSVLDPRIETEKGGDSVTTAGVIDTEDSGTPKSSGSYLPVSAAIPVNQAAFCR